MIATASANSSLVSKCMHIVNGGVANGSQIKANRSLKLNLSVTHNGLRSLNSFDGILHIRRMVKATTQRRKFKYEETRPSRIIVCGMTVIFIGMEVGPWSKTGGLGDVLGGLPPAMAVSSN